MSQASIIDPHFLSFLPTSIHDIVVLVGGGICAFLLSYLLTFGVIKLSRQLGWLDRPSARRVHEVAVPRLGGVAMFGAFVLASLFFYTPGRSIVIDETTIYWLFLSAALLIVAVHAYDDVKGLKPWPKLLAQTLAVIILLGPGLDSMFHGIVLYGWSNPFYNIHWLPWYHQPEMTLFIHKPEISLLAIPAVLLTWFWMAGMMNTVNLIDGLDGLATGLVGITGIIITIISWMLAQYSIATLAAIFSGAVLGFLPHNWNPAKIFMGDSGSQFLGLGLAALSIMGGAKLAMALMVLGIPILDVAVVMINRIRRGQHPLHYDRTHLHYRLLATGLSVKQICYLFYSLTLIFGALTFFLPGRIYKLLGIGLVVLTMIGLIVWIDYRQRQRGVYIKLGGPDPTTPAPADSNEQEILDDETADESECKAAETPQNLPRSEVQESKWDLEANPLPPVPTPRPRIVPLPAPPPR